MAKQKKEGKGPSIKDQLKAQRHIRANIDGTEPPSDTDTEEEEEEGTNASDLTVAQLKEALDDAGVEYENSAKKADLVALYEENGLGETE